ncbi:TPA: hypothetical protein RXL44_003950 [Escherichia coli]|nr:hypothetical protein [Escherichia coli]HBM8311796.1 hypothetical protein [Escherichia coli]HBP9354095.1 hypothetical protein [Escherichia coli]HDV1022645.1 hypothetical protein [Escherichia coli]HDV1070121.1 hypothetical protein [Escherichia coli]
MRRTFTAEEKASVFELWKNGTGFSEITATDAAGERRNEKTASVTGQQGG